MIHLVWLLHFVWRNDEVVAFVNGCAGQEVSKEDSRAKRYSKTGQNAALMREEPLSNIAATSPWLSSHARSLLRSPGTSK